MRFEIVCYDRELAVVLMRKFADKHFSSQLTQKCELNPCGFPYDGKIKEIFIVNVLADVVLDCDEEKENIFLHTYRTILNENELPLSGEYVAVPSYYNVAHVM